MKSITMLKLKVENPPVDLLEQLADLCRRGRNIGLENWLLRQRGLPETAKQYKPSSRIPKDGKPKEKTESTKIYHAITAGVPNLSTGIVAKLGKEVWENINSKIDWRRNDKEKTMRKKDAIVEYQERPPWFMGDNIPVLNKHTFIEFNDELSIHIRNVLRSGESLDLSVSLKGVPPKLKLLIRSLADGSIKLRDSKLVFKTNGSKNGAWYWFVPVLLETEERPDVDNIAHLRPNLEWDSDQSDRPFVIDFPSGRSWYVGDGRYLQAQALRYGALRKAIGYRYRGGRGTGHGRQKVDAAVRKRRYQFANIADHVKAKAINDILNRCIKNKCGTLVYHQPSNPAKEKCWFNANGVDFDWTTFFVDLKNAASKPNRSIIVKKEQLKIADILNST